MQRLEDAKLDADDRCRQTVLSLLLCSRNTIECMLKGKSTAIFELDEIRAARNIDQRLAVVRLSFDYLLS